MSDEERSEPGDESDLLHRALALLVHGALPASLAVAILAGGAAGAALLGASLLESRFETLSLLGLALVLVGAPYVPIALHAGPLAAFALALDGSPSLARTMSLATRATFRVFVPLLLICTSLPFVGAGAFVLVTGIFEPPRDPLVVIPIVLGGGGMILFGAWIQGVLLATAASAVLERPEPGADAPIVPLIAVGGSPMLAATAVATGAYLRAHALPQGLKSLLETPAAIGGAGLFLAAHIVSCALAVALVTRDREGFVRKS